MIGNKALQKAARPIYRYEWFDYLHESQELRPKSVEIFLMLKWIGHQDASYGP